MMALRALMAKDFMKGCKGDVVWLGSGRERGTMRSAKACIPCSTKWLNGCCTMVALPLRSIHSCRKVMAAGASGFVPRALSVYGSAQLRSCSSCSALCLMAIELRKQICLVVGWLV